ncbi:MarR family transcriptional regulator [Bradyrhizobium jicamae]|uniref:MarR family winged helix-turn-helix transcriptional regulator n=1 Tax=Bradyrhizobium jicamae TaxID=280332 RepID=UPI001BADE749|nr:MarR family transcriptional regulator [Bradyrhizobium jicamae]MBR0757978.1 MarR family transcriptional regulator [Bradyrhizobium jicamae]
MERARTASPDALRLSAWLPYRLFIVAARIARPLETFYGERFGLSQAAWRILAIIAERTGASASEIGQACALDPFAVSRGIGQLVERGFARRATARSDRRFAAVSITARGRAAFDEIASLGRVIEADLLASLSSAEREVIDGMLRKLEGESARIESAGWRALQERAGR